MYGVVFIDVEAERNNAALKISERAIKERKRWSLPDRQVYYVQAKNSPIKMFFFLSNQIKLNSNKNPTSLLKK